MRKKKIIISLLVCALLCTAFSVVAFADGHDTPIIPIHTKHTYASAVTQNPDCTEPGIMTYTCTYCSKLYTEEIAPLGHMFNYNDNQTNEGVELVCAYCGITEVVSAESLKTTWNPEYINKAPSRTAKNNISAYLDLDGNRIINGKDYAMIIKLATNEIKLIELHERSLTGSETIEEL